MSGATGTCEAEGFCSFPDPDCPSGQRFEPNAGDSLAGQCTTSPDAPVVDAPPPVCGALGQACCIGDKPCGAGTFCSADTCRQCVTEIALGNHFTCSIRHDGTVWCSGQNQFGQLGNGTITPITMPSPAIATQVSDQIAVIADATAVAGGFQFACAVRSGGTVWCWGRGTGGELGNAMSVDQVKAVQVVEADLTPLDQIVEIGAGFSHVCGRDTAGGVWCWGRNFSGELGDGTTTGRNVAAPVLVAAGGAPLAGASELQVGASHACVRQAGQMSCWGRNTSGQLGDTTTTNRLVPVALGSPLGFAAGMAHTCVVNADTSVSCSGANNRGQLGIGTGGGFRGTNELTPKQVVTRLGGPPLLGVAAVALGSPMSCARLDAGGVACWGDNNNGQTGAAAGNPVPGEVLARDGGGPITPLRDVDRLVARFSHACAHTRSGTWLCWGRNRDGEFGDGGYINYGLATPLVAVTCP